MNNVFEILNDTFQHNHRPSFTEADFRKLFGAESELGGGFFGEYSAFVSEISFHGKLNQQGLLSNLKIELNKQNITLNENLRSAASDAACPGLYARVEEINQQFSINIDRGMFDLLIPTVCSIVGQCSSPDYRAMLKFVGGVRPCGSNLKASSRAYGTNFQVQPDGIFNFRDIRLENGIFNPTHLFSPVPFDPDSLREVVEGLFSSGILEFEPVTGAQDIFQRFSI